jgi:hypothetical protein
LDVIVVQAQLLSDLLVRQVEPHEIQTQDPGPKRLMVSSQNSTGQVIEPRSAILTPVPLPMSLGFIMAMADHGGAGTARAANAVRPSIVPDQLIALGIIDQGRQSDHLQRSHGQYRLMGDAGHCSNQTPSKKAIICHRTRWSHPAHSSASTPKPRMSRLVTDPQRQASTPPQTSFIGRPVRHLELHLRDMMAPGVIVFVRHVGR